MSASVGAGGAQRTTVDVYDVAGRRVATWAAWATPSDRWDPEWDERHGSGQLVPSGVYFVRPRDGSSTSRKVIVVR
ncbi:MAG: T9SS type A sorting domain-containing protein [Candidatus Eiseniibacteriota bacterium]